MTIPVSLFFFFGEGKKFQNQQTHRRPNDLIKHLNF